MSWVYTAGNVVSIPLFKQYRTERKRLIAEWKNKLLTLSPEQFHTEKVALVKALKAAPYNLTLRIRWELLREVEND